MSDGIPIASLMGTLLGAGIILMATNILFNRQTGKYYHRQTGREIPKGRAESLIRKEKLKKVI